MPLQWKTITQTQSESLPEPQPPRQVDPEWEALMSALNQGQVVEVPCTDEAGRRRGKRPALGRRGAGKGFKVDIRYDEAHHAIAAREVGWSEVPLICSHVAVPGALDHVVRVLIHVNTARPAGEMRHVDLKDARRLRPQWGISDEEEHRLASPAARSPVAAGAGGVSSRLGHTPAAPRHPLMDSRSKVGGSSQGACS